MEGTREGVMGCPGGTVAKRLPHREQYLAIAGLFVPHFGHAIHDTDILPASSSHGDKKIRITGFLVP